MKRYVRVRNVLAVATVATARLFASPANVDTTKNTEWRLTAEKDLGNERTTDMFLRKDHRGHTYLYVVSANDTLVVLDVTKSDEMRLMTQSKLNDGGRLPYNRPEHVAAAELDSGEVQDLSTPDLSTVLSADSAKKLKNVDAYTIDDRTNTVYAVERGRLLAVHFDRPITREAEIWKQSYDAR